MKNSQQERIELRSEKIRNISGRIPPVLIRTGNSVIAIILLLLVIIASKFPYPFTIEVNGKLVNKEKVELFIPYRYNQMFDECREMKITFEGRPNLILSCNISAVNDKIKCIRGKNYFCAYANISQNIIESAKLQKGINVQAAIVINNKTIMEIITAKIREKRGSVYTQEQKEKVIK